MNTRALLTLGIILAGCGGAGITETTSGTSGSGGTTTNSRVGSSGVGGAPGTTGSTSTGDATTVGSTSSGGDTTGSTSGATTGAGGSGGSPYDTPPVCTSNMMWTGGDSGNQLMHPGRACMSCHVVGGQASGKTFDVAGTVYPTAHEPDDCDGFAGAQVIITDGNNQEHTLTTNAAGNFYHQDYFGFLAFPKPLKARVVYGGKTRAMVAAQMTGDCDSCHTENGANSAPGRIMLP